MTEGTEDHAPLSGEVSISELGKREPVENSELGGEDEDNLDQLTTAFSKAAIGDDGDDGDDGDNDEKRKPLPKPRVPSTKLPSSDHILGRAPENSVPNPNISYQFPTFEQTAVYNNVRPGSKRTVMARTPFDVQDMAKAYRVPMENTYNFGGHFSASQPQGYMQPSNYAYQNQNHLAHYPSGSLSTAGSRSPTDSCSSYSEPFSPQNSSTMQSQHSYHNGQRSSYTDSYQTIPSTVLENFPPVSPAASSQRSSQQNSPYYTHQMSPASSYCPTPSPDSPPSVVPGPGTYSEPDVERTLYDPFANHLDSLEKMLTPDILDYSQSQYLVSHAQPQRPQQQQQQQQPLYANVHPPHTAVSTAHDFGESHSYMLESQQYVHGMNYHGILPNAAYPTHPQQMFVSQPQIQFPPAAPVSAPTTQPQIILIVPATAVSPAKPVTSYAKIEPRPPAPGEDPAPKPEEVGSKPRAKKRGPKKAGSKEENPIDRARKALEKNTDDELLQLKENGQTVLTETLDCCKTKGVKPTLMALLEATNTRPGLKQLLSKPNKMNQTPLFLAAYHNQTSILKKLVEAGVDCNVKATISGCKEPLTALHYACTEGNKEVVEILVQPNYNVDLDSYTCGMTALQLAIANHATTRGSGNSVRVLDMKPVIRLLLRAGAKVGLTDISGKTAVHYAVETGDSEVVKLIAERCAGTDLLNDTDYEKQSPLSIAARLNLSRAEEKERIVMCLQNYGARKSEENISFDPTIQSFYDEFGLPY